MRRREVEGGGEYVDKVGKEQVECSEVEDSTEALYIIHDHNRGGTDLDEALMDSNEKKRETKRESGKYIKRERTFNIKHENTV